MADRHYKHAPIVEALIDLQVEYPALPQESQFYDCAGNLSKLFPIVVPIHHFQFDLADGAGSPAPVVKSDMNAIGLRLDNPDETRVLQIQQRGFTYSHLPPYSRWLEFRSEAESLWSTFREKLLPSAVTRVGVRNINRIAVPSSPVDFDTYFNLSPRLPKNMNQTVAGCYMQLVLPQADISPQASAVINFALEPSQYPGKLSFLLDIELFCACRFEASSEEIWVMLDKLRVRKNELFEACITDKTRGLFHE